MKSNIALVALTLTLWAGCAFAFVAAVDNALPQSVVVHP